MPLDVRQLSPTLGAEITGVDLAGPLSDDDFARIRQAHLDHCVVVFPDQHLTPVEHIAFSRRFGALHIHMLEQYLMDGHPELLVLSNVKRDGRAIDIEDAGRYWHSDVTYEEVPPLGSLLYGVEVPPAGGDTWFANMYAAYDALDAAMKARLAGLRAVHRYNIDRQRRQRGAIKITEEQAARIDEVAHPVVRTHPETGRKALYVNPGFTIGIDGMAESESTALLTQLFGHTDDPAFHYRHVWRPRDLVFWDNRCVMHRATDYDPDHTRHMLRTTVAGDRPF